MLAATAPARGDADDGRHDFDFFHGCWQVHNRRLTQRNAGPAEWREFPATLDCRPLLGGLGNIDEYRSAEVQGLTLRLFDPQQRRWSDRWASARDGLLGLPAYGSFRDGVGRFVGEDRDDGGRILSRALWTDIGPNAFVWEQAASRDDGASWDTNWIMRITRAE
ncbi:hypothetical protein H8B22_07355 [Lysobacter terrestris]|uniref:DUF1579 domain-containing protein n=1 Tax=Agrilutibacter terrestris TaxID=2865112 RepID=A0A7H0G1G3_9GAMM|nr:hypothetical protein H8B22_07355 [Lysobacter terrestris]